MVGGIGRTFISAGVLILLFVAYQLWGTNIAEARHQDDLQQELAEVLEPEGDDAVPGPATPAAERPPAPPPPPEGTAVAMMRVPMIGMEKAVVVGVGVGDLKKGPGHYPETPMPGQPGNSAIAGHRTTYGAPFSRLDELVGGDDILVTTRQGRFLYEVREVKVVTPREVAVLQQTNENLLTLTTCHPKLSAKQRLVVIATLTGEAAEPPPEAPPPDPAVSDEPEEEPAAERPVEMEAGLSGDPASKGPALLWGGLAAAIWLAAWLLARAWRKVPAYVIGSLAFFPVLFVFFENVARLLPANV